MNKKQKILSFTGAGIIILSVIAYIVFSDKTLCKGLEINVITGKDSVFADKKDIENLIFSEYKNLLGSPIDKVNLEQLEKDIEKLPTVKNAEVYKKINGILGVKVERRNPVLRVFTENKKSFYIDNTGEIMPLSDDNPARVIIASGKIKYDKNTENISVFDTVVNKTVKEIFEIASYLNKDEFLKNQINQIFVTQKGEYELVPIAGNHIIMLGDIFNFKKKADYLKFFYENTLKKEGYKKYKYINLKYKNQIICTKR